MKMGEVKESGGMGGREVRYVGVWEVETSKGCEEQRSRDL